jgi:hypothetical protein
LTSSHPSFWGFEFDYGKMVDLASTSDSDDDTETDQDGEEDHQEEGYIAKEENADLDTLLKHGHIHRLRVLSCSVKKHRAPRNSKTLTPYKIIQQGSMPMTYSYGGWSKAVQVKLSECHVEGLMIPDVSTYSNTVLKYAVRLLFGDKVMYVQMRIKGKRQRRFYNMYCVPYRAPGQTRPVRNRDSLLA